MAASTLTTISSKADYKSLISDATGKTVLVAHWPGDSTSEELLAALAKLLPPSDYAKYGVVDTYGFDVYALPDLAEDVGVTFVPTLMWFQDGVQDALVWHDGVRVTGESVEKGVKRVVERIKGASDVGLEEDSDDDW